MTSLNLPLPQDATRPPHVPAFGIPLRAAVATIIGALGCLALYFDWPFARIGTLQPVLLALGMALIAYVTDIPFQGLWSRLGLIGVFMIGVMAGLVSWYSGGDIVSGDALDIIWKWDSVFLISFILAAGFWNAPYRNFHSKLASVPMMFIVLFAFIGCALWTVTFSFSDAQSFPIFRNFVGLHNYRVKLFADSVWWTACTNAVIYLVLVTAIEFVLGFLIAVFMDQKVRAEGVFRTIYLYPFALSFIVTGHVWAWIMSPEYGLEKSVRDMGWTSFHFDWITDPNRSIYAVVVAGIWQGTGLVMALMLAGLRGIDDEVWKAARVDGIPKWRTYLQIVLPMMRPVMITTFVIVASGCVRVYDIVVALTDGGPGTSSKVPAQYVYQYLFQGGIARGLAASTIMLLASAVILIPWVYVEFIKGKQTR
jgi:glucose/mannose transport system permease protein